MAPFEKACRALCKMDGYVENETLDGHTRWRSYAPQVKAVISSLQDHSQFMQRAALRVGVYSQPGDHGAIWRAMLDAVEE